jgi:hypothetical protein
MLQEPPMVMQPVGNAEACISEHVHIRNALAQGRVTGTGESWWFTCLTFFQCLANAQGKADAQEHTRVPAHDLQRTHINLLMWAHDTPLVLGLALNCSD